MRDQGNAPNILASGGGADPSCCIALEQELAHGILNSTESISGRLPRELHLLLKFENRGADEIGVLKLTKSKQQAQLAQGHFDCDVRFGWHGAHHNGGNCSIIPQPTTGCVSLTHPSVYESDDVSGWQNGTCQPNTSVNSNVSGLSGLIAVSMEVNVSA